jgi:hypothetical protein
MKLTTTIHPQIGERVWAWDVWRAYGGAVCISLRRLRVEEVCVYKDIVILRSSSAHDTVKAGQCCPDSSTASYLARKVAQELMGAIRLKERRFVVYGTRAVFRHLRAYLKSVAPIEHEVQQHG